MTGDTTRPASGRGGVSRGTTATRHNVARAGLLFNVVALGALMIYARYENVPIPSSASTLARLQVAAMLMAAGALVGIMFLRRRRGRTASPERRNTQALIGSMLAQGVGAFGFFIIGRGGPPYVWIAGILLFAVAWVALPSENAPGAVGA